jgi:CspA family cold shock protein
MVVNFLDKGTVTKWFDWRGFGFIDVDGLDKDVFVHTTDVKGIHGLREGEEVEFDIIDTYKGPKAVNVQSISE